MNMNNNLFNIIKFSLICFPILLITGPLLTDLVGSLIGIFFITYISVKKKLNIFQNIYFKYFLIIFVYLNINSFFSFNYEVSMPKTVAYIRIIFFIFAIGYFINFFSNNDIENYFYITFFACVLFLLLDSIIITLFNFNLFGVEVIASARIKSFFGDEGIMGSYTAKLLPLVIGISYYFKFKKRELFNNFLISCSMILILLSGERLALFNFVIFILFYFIILKKNPLHYLWILIISISLVSMINPSSLTRIFVHTITQITKQTTNLTLFSYRHQMHYRTAYEMFEDNILLGHGLKSFRNLCDDKKYQDSFLKKRIIDESKSGVSLMGGYKNACNTHPHNIYFEFLSELGIIGFILFSIIFLYITYELFILTRKSFNRDNFKNEDMGLTFIIVCIFISMFPFAPSGSYFNNWSLFVNYLPIGFFLGYKNKNFFKNASNNNF